MREIVGIYPPKETWDLLVAACRGKKTKTELAAVHAEFCYAPPNKHNWSWVTDGVRSYSFGKPNGKSNGTPVPTQPTKPLTEEEEYANSARNTSGKLTHYEPRRACVPLRRCYSRIQADLCHRACHCIVIYLRPARSVPGWDGFAVVNEYGFQRMKDGKPEIAAVPCQSGADES